MKRVGYLRSVKLGRRVGYLKPASLLRKERAGAKGKGKAKV